MIQVSASRWHRARHRPGVASVARYAVRQVMYVNFAEIVVRR
jgi:hypothetical protein